MILLLLAAWGSVVFCTDLFMAVWRPGATVGVQLGGEMAQAAVARLRVPPGAELRSMGSDVAELVVPALPLGLRLLAVAGSLLTTAAWTVGALYGRRVLAAMERGEVFHPRNLGRVRRIAGVVLLGGAVGPWLTWWAHREVLARIGMEREAVSLPAVDVAFFALVLAMFFAWDVADAFRLGRKRAETRDEAG